MSNDVTSANHYSDAVLQLLSDNIAYANDGSVTIGESQNPALMVNACSDSRVVLSDLLGAKEGDAFTRREVAGIVPPNEENDKAIKAFLSFPMTGLDAVEALLVLGHTDCGGVDGLVDNILKGTPEGHDSVVDFVYNIKTDELDAAIKLAAKNGSTEAEISDSLDYVVPLINAKNILEQELVINGEHILAGDLMAEKGIVIVPAIENLKTKEIELFTPSGYVPLKELLAKSVEQIEDNEEHIQPAFAAGAKVDFVAKISVKDIDRGIKSELDNLLEMKDKFNSESVGRG